MDDRLGRIDWIVIVGLLALSAIPVAASGLRLAELVSGEITPQNARFFDGAVSTVLHVASSSVFGVIGAFQFAPKLRRRSPGWHRQAGRVLIVCGLVSALSGLWMTHTFPRVPGDTELLDAFRYVFGTAMAVCMVWGYVAVRRRDIAEHRAWIMRGYAIGLGAGTQVVVHIPWLLAGGRTDGLVRALLLGAGWAINLGIAEWIIRGHARRSRSGVRRHEVLEERT